MADIALGFSLVQSVVSNRERLYLHYVFAYALNLIFITVSCMYTSLEIWCNRSVLLHIFTLRRDSSILILNHSTVRDVRILITLASFLCGYRN